MPADSTEQRLIAAAERLFAEQGVDAVSMRGIMQAAETNVAAVHYHFGGKRGLLDAVLRSRAGQVSSERDSLLTKLTGAAPTQRELAHAYVRPVLAVRRSGGEHWIRLVGRLLTEGDDRLAVIAGPFAERNAAFLELLRKASPGADTATLHFRLTQAMNLTLTVLGDLGRTRRLLDCEDVSWSGEAVVEQLIDLVTAVFAGPPETRDSTRHQ
ncbi:TetR/AcrR family transcriptional regulator [Amycolatopsis sp. YIM 10]|uniref:TetR/AcrR family transcriptional regulator n=1 Tax=Amycolatopsis sp. YIM 10 TaxID=2653857 RepID=UPI0012A861E1|nr:TetR/AcrR family transcriptional regulator [Amycolatopsis sp. YIM 10]QFU91871.1 putative DNA-binding transcriptional regulator [Amycolatopsis sp. YIM 10]